MDTSKHTRTSSTTCATNVQKLQLHYKFIFVIFFCGSHNTSWVLSSTCRRSIHSTSPMYPGGFLFLTHAAPPTKSKSCSSHCNATIFSYLRNVRHLKSLFLLFTISSSFKVHFSLAEGWLWWQDNIFKGYFVVLSSGVEILIQGLGSFQAIFQWSLRKQTWTNLFRIWILSGWN